MKKTLHPMTKRIMQELRTPVDPAFRRILTEEIEAACKAYTDYECTTPK